MNVLVVSAHPDDEILGVGGTVALHVRRGDEVKLAVMYEGVTARHRPDRLAEVKNQSARAAEILGVADLLHCDLPDQRLDTLPLGEVARPVEEIVHGFEPAVVYTHFGGDINRESSHARRGRPGSDPAVRRSVRS